MLLTGTVVSKKIFILIFTLFIFSNTNANAVVDTSWLVGQQNTDGSFSAQNDISLQTQNTSEALQTLYVTGDIALVDESLAIQFLSVSDFTHLENLVAAIYVNNNAGLDVSGLIVQLKSFINNDDGGFSGIVGYQSTVLSTALAIQALAVSGSLLDNDFSYAVGFLTGRQNTDGSWSSDGNTSSVYITAIASQALQKIQTVFNVTGNINNANNFLLSYLQNNIVSTENFEIALAVLSIAPSTVDKTVYQFLVDQLIAMRNADGSWAQDTYTTALSIRALLSAETGVSADKSLLEVVAPASNISAVTGLVTDNLSGLPLSGALINVRMADGRQVNTLSGQDGRYIISQLSPGNVSIAVSFAGYHSVSASPVLSPGVVHYFNPALLLQPQPVPLNIKGTVVDADSSLPLAGATIQVVNSSIAIQTDAAGTFQLNNVLPGSVTLQISSTGYILSSSVISAASGGEINLGLIALKPGSATGNTGTVSGYITDSISGKALNGVVVTLSGSDNKTAFTGIDGRFVINNVNPGNINITAGLSGYINAISTTDIIAGSNTQFNATLVNANDQAQVTLQGSIIDSQTLQPLSGVSVQIVNQALSTLSTENGQFQLGNITPGSFNVSLTLNAYNAITYSVTAEGGALLNMGQFALTLSAPVSGNQPPVITSTAPVNAQVGQTYSYALQAGDADNDVITYGFLSRPNGMSIDSLTGLIKWEPTATQVGTQSFTVLAFDNQGGKAQETATVNVAIGGNDIYMVTDVQTLQGLYIQNIVPQNYALGTYVTGGRPNIMMSAAACPLNSFVEGPATTPVAEILSSLERLTTSQALGVEIGAGVGTQWGGDLIMDFTTPQDTIAVFPVVDHTPFPEEGIEYTVWGSNDPSALFPDGWTLGTLVSIYTQGYVQSPQCAGQNESDDYAGLYTFASAVQYVRVRAANSISIFKTPAHIAWSTTLDNGTEPGWQSIEGEIDSVGAMSCSVKPAANAGADISGRTGEPIQFDASSTPGNILTYGWDLDNDSEIDFTGMNPTHIFNAGFDQDVTLYAVNDQGCVGVDTVRVTIDLNFPKPDLIIDSLTVDNISTNLQTLQVYGSAQVSVKNTGLAPANIPALVTVFEDTNANGIFDISVDNILGAITMPSGLARNDAVNIAIPLNGRVNFRDSPVYAMVDSDNKIIESDETNNTDTTLSQCRGAVNTPQQIVLKEKWYWDGSQSAVTNADANVFGPVMVGQLNDDNGDSLIDVNDIPDAIFVSYTTRFGTGTLRAVSGVDGTELWSTNAQNPTLLGSIALGDIDNDGLIEIVAVSLNRNEIIAYEHTGDVKWIQPTGLTVRSGDSLALADLDHDGQVEILHGNRVYDSNGNLLWSGSRDSGGRSNAYISIAADVDNSGDMEVIAGRTLYDSQGNVIWHQGSIPDGGFNAVGNFDDDDFPEIVLVSIGQIYLLEHTGEIIWGPVALPGGGNGGAPTVADFDGDGKPEIGVAGSSRYVVFETNGAVKWQNVIQDVTSHQTGSSLFDFEADGKAEILYADEVNFYIFDGATGDVRLSIPNGSLTALEYPVVADIDNDGQAEIIVAANATSGRNGIRVFESGLGTWAPTRSIWNQHSYHIDNINDDGTIPKNEAASWLTHNSYRLNTFANGSAASLADISASLLKINANSTNQPANISVRIGNGGELSVGQPVDINFYEGNPATGGILLGTVSINNLASGTYQDIVLNNIPALSGNKDIVVVADAGNVIQECNELNNTVSLTVFAGSASAQITVATGVNQYTAGTQIPLQGIVTNNSAIPGQFIAKLQVEDTQTNVIKVFPQKSTDVLAGGVLAGQASINITDSWDSSGFLAGNYLLRGQLYDLQGEIISSATTLFTLNSAAGQTLASLRTNTDRPLYHTSDQVQIENLLSNLSTDSIIDNAQLQLTVTNSDNATVYTQTITLSALAAGSQRQSALDYVFTNEPQGRYQVSAQLLSQNNNILASGQASYIVESDASKAIAGQSSVQAISLNRGQAQTCTDTVQNTGALNLTNLNVQQIFLEVNSKQLLQSSNQNINLTTGSQQTLVRNINTAELNAGDYICALQVNIKGNIQILDFAAFSVTEAPVQVVGDIASGTRGQILIWQGEENHKAHGRKKHKIKHARNEKYNDNNHSDTEDDNNRVAERNSQRQYLQTLLKESAWSYTLVNNRNDFIDAFSSGEYQAYMLLNVRERPGKTLEKALREAVYRGEGLMIASAIQYHGWLMGHGKNHSPLAQALGLRAGKHTRSTKTFNFVENNALELQGSIPFEQTKQIQDIKLEQAQAVLQYEVNECRQSRRHFFNARDKIKIKGIDKDSDKYKKENEDACNDIDNASAQKQYATAVSFNQYGQGRAVFAGFDLLAYAARYQDKTLLTDLINKALIKTHPPAVLLSSSNIVPFSGNVNNLGSDAQIKVSMT
ncbi:hypothetical protein MNBD_GAMMA09-805, partial [hydrothermal vent metagenome]